MWPYLLSVWQCRNFWLSLVFNDLQRRYRHSVLGVGWSLLHPLATALVTAVVFHQLFHLPLRTFLPFVLSGLACWSYLTAATLQGCQSYIQAEGYIRQHPLPVVIYPLRTTLGALIHFLIALVLVTVIAQFLTGAWGLGPALLLVPGILIFFLLGWALAVLAGLVHVVFRDTQHIMEVVFQILFYLTPIIYPARLGETTRLGRLLACNPLLYFLDLIRQPLLEGRPAPAMSYGIAAAITLLLGTAAVATVGYQQRRVVFYL
jgi:ABC-type polysaccharide/polyol phosphate export permease